MGVFTLTSTDGRGYVLVLGPTAVTIGRNKDNVLAISDDAASRYHCVIEQVDSGSFQLRDLGSRNGTKVNGERLVSSALKIGAGDQIKIGTHTFTVEVEQSLTEARQTARSMTMDTELSGVAAATANWQAELTMMLDLLPPKSEGGSDTAVQLIDANNQLSNALSQSSPGPMALRMLLLVASKSRATDVHVEPKQNTCSIRVRVDGQMVAAADLPAKVGQLVLGTVKAACQMRTEGLDAIHDGHFACKFRGKRVDYRVSITPSVHGQKLVIRVLDQALAPRALQEMGLPPYMYEKLKKVTQKEQGFVLVCGPTGSGKTTTLYNALREIDRETSNIVTIEDPVEYQLEGVTQIPFDAARGNTFGSLLRSVLRQDPDVILVGEIRDEETARTALQAAMTGHLVFSTVHSKDSISAVFRVLDLKVEPTLVASSLDLVLAQRLLRVLCDTCKRSVPVKPGESTRIGRYLEGKSSVFVPVGCAACLKTGHRGRKAIFEMLDFNDELRDLVLGEPTIMGMKRIIEKGLFTTLQQSGWVLAARGVTDLDEVERVCGGGHSL